MYSTCHLQVANESIYHAHVQLMMVTTQYISLQPANVSIVHVQYMYMYMLVTICALLYSTCICTCICW